MFRPSRQTLAAALVLASLAVHFGTVVLFSRQPDRFAAFTVIPVWIWGSFGLLLSCGAFLLFRARLSLFMTATWILTVLLVADETRGLARLGSAPLVAGPPARFDGREVVRVATLNRAGSNENFSELIIRHQPDIIFIQEIAHPYRLRQLNETLFQGKGDYRYDKHTRCGLVVRGVIEHHIPNPPALPYRNQQVRAKLPNGRRVELVNVHLQAASTDLSLWKRECWRSHCHNRQERRSEIAFTLQKLEKTNINPKLPAVIIAGDFNAPAGDRVFRLLEDAFSDTFSDAGAGWGNTYHSSFPLLRLDYIFASPAFYTARSRAVRVEESDHRMVVSDLVFR